MAESICRVLYIEDTPEDVRLLEEGIRAAEVPVAMQTVARAEQAIEVLVSDVPLHVVLLDWNLPGQTGAELLCSIRQHRPNVPVFVLTGLPISVAPKDVGDQIETVIAKPFTMEAWEDLARLLSSFCDDIGALETRPALL